MDLTVPADYGVVASGEPETLSSVATRSAEAAAETRRYRYVTLQPARVPVVRHQPLRTG